MYDEKMLDEIELIPRAIVGWILMASYAYYHLDESLISDELYDNACKALLENYDDVDHFLKHLLPKDALAAGTAYHLKRSDYPQGLIRCVLWLLKEAENK